MSSTHMVWPCSINTLMLPTRAAACRQQRSRSPAAECREGYRSTSHGKRDNEAERLCLHDWIT